MDKEAKRANHDLGDASEFTCEPVDMEPHGLTDFDREVDALRSTADYRWMVMPMRPAGTEGWDKA